MFCNYYKSIAKGAESDFRHVAVVPFELVWKSLVFNLTVLSGVAPFTFPSG